MAYSLGLREPIGRNMVKLTKSPGSIPAPCDPITRRAPTSPFALEAYFCQGCYHQAGARALFHSLSNYGKIQTIDLLFRL